MPASRLSLLFHTIRYLKPGQVSGRIRHRLYRPKPDLRPSPPTREPLSWKKPATKKTSLTKPWVFTFLNHTHECRFPSDWNSDKLDKLWLYNLHYFDDLCSPDAAEKRELHQELVETWIHDNPPGHGNGWEPYPLSLRIVNWIKWVLAGNRVEGLHESLAIQIRYLTRRLEYHLLGNHLFANGKALIFGGLFFEGNEAEKWYSEGIEIIKQEIDEQALDDGGHFERSPMYHAIILEDLLDLINVMKAFGRELPKHWLKTSCRMMEWLQMMCHPDGGIALFNDAAFQIAASQQELFDYGRRIDLPFRQCEPTGLTHFEESGYISYHTAEAAAFLDVAQIGPDYLPGHAHADTLNFELSLFGTRVIVDSGTSCYGTSRERLRQRGTAAHNTVMIDGEDSSEVWSGFRVARRARPVGLEIDEIDGVTTIRCCHDGYQRLPGKPIHCREWRFPDRTLTIVDRIDGKFSQAIGRFHLHPEVEVSIEEGQQSGRFSIDGLEDIQWEATGASVRVNESTYHPEFGTSIPNQCLELIFQERECSFQLRW